MIRIVYNFTASVAKQVRANKKHFIAHPSIVLALLDYPFEVINTEVSGHLVESLMVNNLEKISFWRTPQKDEVDIILKKQNKLIPIEVKYKSQITKNDLRSLLKFCDKFKLKKGIVVTKDLFKKEEVDKKEILFVPVWLFLLTK